MQSWRIEANVTQEDWKSNMEEKNTFGGKFTS